MHRRKVGWLTLMGAWVIGIVLTSRLLGAWITAGIVACLAVLVLLPLWLTEEERKPKDPSGEHPALG